MADDLVERLRGEIERRRDASGDMLYRGAPDTALTEAADAIESLRAENARLKRDMANLKANGIHSCHADCQRPLCVAQRENARLTEERDALVEAAYREGHARGRVDGSPYEEDRDWLNSAALAKVKGGADAR